MVGPFRLNSFFLDFKLQEARELEKSIQSKPQSPVSQVAAMSPKFSHLKQNQAQSKPTTPEKTELTNGEHARSGSGKVSSENGDAPRERGPSLSGTPCASSPSVSDPVSEGQMKVPGSICRKPLIAAHVFLGLHLCFAFKRHNQRGMMSSVLSYCFLVALQCSGFGLGCLSPSSYLGG